MNIEKEKELYRQMDLLQIKEISTYRQQKNGTRIFQLPIKKYGQYIEVGSFKSGYVRRMNGGYTPYQLNKCEPNTEYHAEYKWCTIQRTSLKTGKYTKYEGKKRILIPDEIDRIDHLITYCLKNYYINGANQVEDGKFVSKWQHEYEMKNGSLDRVRELQAENRKLTQEMDEMNDKHTDMCDRFESAAMELSDLHCSGKDCKITELKDSLDSSDYRIKDLERMLEGYKTREKDLENKLDKAEKNEFYPYSMEIRVNGQKYKVV